MATIVFTPSQDAYISEFYSNQNFGSVPFLYVSRYKAAGDIYRSLIQFDLCSLVCNSIPPNSHIKSAYLKLPVYRNEVGKKSIILKVFRVLQAWGENTVTWITQPLAANSPDGSEPIAAGFFGTVSICITDLVRGWYKGEIVNNGLLIRGDEAKNNLVGFFSSNYPNTSKWPRLVVNYDVCCCRDHKHCGDDRDFEPRLYDDDDD